MGLEEDLKARALGLISQQMANWVVEIQRQIGEHQASLVQTLDDLQENVARYDEKINEADIEAAMAEVVAQQPPPVPKGPGLHDLRSGIAEIERGSSLAEVLTFLVNEVARHVDRAAMFIVKGPSAIGWYARGVNPPEAVKQLNVPLSADTVFRNVQNRTPYRGPIAASPGTQQVISRLGGQPVSVLAVPLILRDKLAAILYCDSTRPEIPGPYSDLIEMLVLFAAKSIDLLSLVPKPAAAHAAAPAPAPRPAPPAPAPPPPPPPRPAAPAPPVPHEEGAATLMFNATQFAPPRPPAPPPRPAPAPAPAAPAIAPEEQKSHDDAKRFARLVVSEIKLYNEAKVTEGRRNRDLYERLKEDIERGRHMYNDRVTPHIRDNANYFVDELVRILAGGDAGALGPM